MLAQKIIIFLFTISILITGCTVYKNFHVTSEPTGVRVSRAGGVIGTTPFDMSAGAGDFLFCTPWYWAFYLEAESPYPGYPPIQKNIDPCHMIDNSMIHFDFRLPTKDSEPIMPPGSTGKTGTGFIIDESGIILTAYHVVENATDIKARLYDGSLINLELKAFARANDIAILIAKQQLQGALSIARSGDLRVGEEVYTIGYPVISVLGEEPKYSNGTISSLSGIQGDYSLLQISVPVHPGNSGGPLCNMNGEVVGIVTSTAAVEYFYGKTRTLPQNINWAIKIQYALPLLGQISSKQQPTSPKTLEDVRKGVCLIIAK